MIASIALGIAIVMAVRNGWSWLQTGLVLLLIGTAETVASNVVLGNVGGVGLGFLLIIAYIELLRRGAV